MGDMEMAIKKPRVWSRSPKQKPRTEHQLYQQKKFDDSTLEVKIRREKK